MSRSRAPCNAFSRLPALNVQLAKQLTASGVFRPPHSEARSDARESMRLKTLIMTANYSFSTVAYKL
ncbi:unnamed protein product [Prunus armeniaca]